MMYASDTFDLAARLTGKYFDAQASKESADVYRAAREAANAARDLYELSRKLHKIAERDANGYHSHVSQRRDECAEKRLMARAEEILRPFKVYEFKQCTDPRAGGGIRIYFEASDRGGYGFVV